MPFALIHYIPILTTMLSAVLAVELFRRYQRHPEGIHHLVWGIGVVCYGTGTLIESTITLAGNSILLTKLWYIAGALLGGYPLAQGSAYFHLKRRTANILTAITLSIAVVGAFLVLLSPVVSANLDPARPSGAILAWSWIRESFVPLLNSYSAFFLIGTALWSAFRKNATPSRKWGNLLIALGAILPGIGGGFAVKGLVEVLYIGEFIGLCLIMAGFRLCTRPSTLRTDPQPQPV